MHRITLTIILLFSATAATAVDAASYQKTDGSIVDPIQIYYSGGVHSYSGNNLGPGVNLFEAGLHNADLTGADLTGAILHAAILDHAYLTDADLTNADLTDADLSFADLTNADLRDAVLTGVDLGFTNLYEANLTGADLTDADLGGVAFLEQANLTDADLTGVDLTGVVLTGADLSGSDFSNVLVYDDGTWTDWTDAFYYTDNEPTWHSGMDAAWRTSVGILALAPTSSVPEPSTLLLALIALALLPRRRRR